MLPDDYNLAIAFPALLFLIMMVPFFAVLILMVFKKALGLR
jgi:hypothetical protein